MAITSTQSKNPASVFNMALGRYLDTGTVAAFVLTVGFLPRYVKVVNTDAGIMMEWFEGMTDDYGVLTGVDGARSLVSSDGITVSANGFTVGLNTDLVYTSEQLSWMAVG